MKNIQRIKTKFHSFLARVNFILTLLFGELSEPKIKTVSPVLSLSDAEILKRAAFHFENKKRGGANG
jgi:sortase (surface protein transpeptidase)